MREMKRRDLLKVSLAAAGAAGLGGLAATPARAQGMSFAADFVADFNQKRDQAIEMAEAMPADKYGHKPTPEMRTFGQLIVHAAQACYFFATGAAAVPMPEGARFEGEATKDRIVPYAKKAFAFAADAISKLDDGKAGEVIEVFGELKMTRRKVAEFMRDHVTHHLGYAYPYLREAGVTEVPAYRFSQGNSPV